MRRNRNRGLHRPRYVAAGDRRSPMTRLLEDCDNPATGTVEVAYERQWRTLFKAQRLGYLDDRQRLTEKGRAFLREEKSSALRYKT